MRNIQSILIVAFIFFTTESRSQEITLNELLEGAWLFDLNSSSGYVEPNIKAKLQNDLEFGSAIQLNYSGQKWHFKDNSEFQVSLSTGESKNGAWNIQGSVLTITGPNGYKMSREILRLTEKSLVLMGRNSENSKEIFQQLHFTRY